MLALLYGVMHLPRPTHLWPSFPPTALVYFPLFGGDEVMHFLDFLKWGFPPLIWFVWFGLRGLGENSEPGPALTLTQGQAPGVGFLPQNLPAMVLMCGANLYGGREWGNRLQEQVLSGKTKWIHWKGQEHALL